MSAPIPPLPDKANFVLTQWGRLMSGLAYHVPLKFSQLRGARYAMKRLFR